MRDKRCGDAAEKKSVSGESEGGFKEARFVVYGEPVPKARPRVVGKHAYTPEKTKTAEENIALVYKSQYHGFVFKKGTPLRLVMDFYFKIPKSTGKGECEAMVSGEKRPTKRPDIDNCQKCVMDAGNGVIWEDDSQVVEVLSRKFWSMRPRTEIFIAEVCDG